MSKVKYVIIVDDRGEISVPRSDQPIILEAQNLLDEQYVTVGHTPSNEMYENAMRKAELDKAPEPSVEYVKRF